MDGCGPLLAEPKESCGARRDIKGLLPPPPSDGYAGWSGRESDHNMRQIRNHPGGSARPRPEEWRRNYKRVRVTTRAGL